MDYRKKYLKYKNKYLQLKSYSQLGGSVASIPFGCIPDKRFMMHEAKNYDILCSKPGLNMTFVRNQTDKTVSIYSSSVGLIYQSNLSFVINDINFENIFNFVLDYYYRHNNHTNMKNLLRDNRGCIDAGIYNLIQSCNIYSNNEKKQCIENFQTGTINYFKTLDGNLLKIFLSEYMLNKEIETFFSDYFNTSLFKKDVIMGQIMSEIIDYLMITHHPEVVINKFIKTAHRADGDMNFFHIMNIKIQIFYHYIYTEKDDIMKGMLIIKIDDFINYIRKILVDDLNEAGENYTDIYITRLIIQQFVTYKKAWQEELISDLKKNIIIYFNSDKRIVNNIEQLVRLLINSMSYDTIIHKFQSHDSVFLNNIQKSVGIIN